MARLLRRTMQGKVNREGSVPGEDQTAGSVT